MIDHSRITENATIPFTTEAALEGHVFLEAWC